MEIDDTVGYRKKKISLDIDERIDNLLVDIGSLTDSNKSLVITAIFRDGLPLFVDHLIDSWSYLIPNPTYKGKKEKIKEKIKKAKEIRKKIYWRAE